ncbi:GDP-mannose 4,6-dehydratase [Spirosoma foliorum]|uniref:GDP-mannose 4,6-dehydratase n=1 Tax=Spirosoma foliorum TaxID=2710596 RepID=A0A7G5GSL4_9BACT|nr:GDP-mannose 4,6-dehydratase [Spirosoma foliorum]QMW01856.1 GDP-mannose 4,6-dehydratase [Spirosoma foliorum]
MKTALICGVSGQDGAYLAKLLLEKGYKVVGGSRDAQMSSFKNLERLGIRSSIQFVSISINDFRSVLQTLLKVKPDEVYNLAGQSSVGLSFEQPVETLESISVGTLNLLEAIRFTNQPIKFYNAGSSECFGDTGSLTADENTPFRPRSPYGVAKAAAFWQVANYREAYQIHASTGILFNHESPLRPERFVTQKIVAAACRIANGSNEILTLGNIDIARDWGWAPDYVEAMWLMLQQNQSDDYVIATGKTHKLSDFIRVVFETVGLCWENHVHTDKSFFRPTDIAEGHANPAKALRNLEWKAQFTMSEVARQMVMGSTSGDTIIGK